MSDSVLDIVGGVVTSGIGTRPDTPLGCLAQNPVMNRSMARCGIGLAALKRYCIPAFVDKL